MEYSVVILVKLPSPRFPRALESAKNCAKDVVVVVDTTDGDVPVIPPSLLGANVRVVYRPLDSFAAQRNFGVEQTVNNWVLHLDSDEVISCQLGKELTDMAPNDRNVVYAVRRLTYVWGCPLRHLFANEYVTRVHHKSVSWVGTVHESLRGQDVVVKKLRGELRHYTLESLDQWIRKTTQYINLQGDSLVGWRASKWNVIWRPVYRFLKYFVFELGIMDGFPGLVASLLGAIYEMLLYIRVWEREVQKN